MAEDRDDSQEKTQDPTQRRLDKAREEGKVLSSKEIFVFTSGRHRKIKEIILFYIFSLPQFIFIAFIDILVRYGWEVTYANYLMLLLAGFVNFLVRKFIIFKG